MVASPEGINVKNRFSILGQMDEENNISRHREDGTNDITLGDSQVRDLGTELSNIRIFRTRKRVVMCYLGADTDFIKDRLEVVHGSRGVIIRVRGNSIKNNYGTFESQKY